MPSVREFLRARQGDHALLLLTAEEYSALNKTSELPLPGRHHEHFSRVLRRSASWPALVGDGTGQLSEAVIEHGKIRLPQPAQNLAIAPRPDSVTIAQAWVKPKALSLILQKCAELGVDEIVLFGCERSREHTEKPQRIDAIIENACMQAYNPVKPRVRIETGMDAIAGLAQKRFFGDPESSVWLTPALRRLPTAFVCGPEGGFSPREAEFLRECGQGVLISENVLRAETAAIIAAGILCLNR